MDKVHMQVVERGLIVEVRQDFAAFYVEFFVDRFQALIPNRLQKRQMLTRQVTNRLQVSLLGQRQAVERAYIPLVEFEVLLEEKAFVLVNA